MCGCKTSLVLAAFIFSSLVSQAQPYYDLIGRTALWSTTTNINGSGIRVGQPEANYVQNAEPSVFEVNPANQSQPVSLFTYISADGIANTFTNTVGVESSHGERVANYFYSVWYGMATNVLHVDNYDADYYITNYLANYDPAQNDLVVNQSYTYGFLSVADQEQVDSMYDNYEEMYRTLFVSAVGGGPTSSNAYAPGTSYNGISVGVYDNISGAFFNNIGPTIDNGRCKPDITALEGATSFSTPQVSGASADLMQAALRGDGGSDTNSAFDLRTIKALLLNGAVKPPGWTNASFYPLDQRYGAGVVNVFNSYRQLTGGKNSAIVSQLITAGSSHPPTGDTGTEPVLNGWDFATSTSSRSPAKDAVAHYYFDVSNHLAGARFTATATLAWNRQLNQTNINNLDLFLYNCANSNLVAGSTSLVNNVEHIYQPSLAQGRYDLQVWKAGGSGIVSTIEPYALAFAFYSDTLNVSGSGTNVTLTWPVYPAGFMVENTTNLISPNWISTNLPQPVITNNLNSLQLSATNTVQFFRLIQPNL